MHRQTSLQLSDASVSRRHMFCEATEESHAQTDITQLLNASVSGGQTFCEASEEPGVVCDEVWHGVVEWLQHAQHIVQVKNRVIIPI
jgi:hypothetical protein